MGTRSEIWYYDNKKKKYFGVSCWWDGYLSNNGRLLLMHYHTLPLVKELISHGSISSLEKNINPSDPSKHSYVTREDGVCVFFHRDGKEVLKISESKEIPEIQREYFYLFKNRKWYVILDSKNLLLLTPELIYRDRVKPEEVDNKRLQELKEFLEEREQAKKKLSFLKRFQ